MNIYEFMVNDTDFSEVQYTSCSNCGAKAIQGDLVCPECGFAIITDMSADKDMVCPVEVVENKISSEKLTEGHVGELMMEIPTLPQADQMILEYAIEHGDIEEQLPAEEAMRTALTEKFGKKYFEIAFEGVADTADVAAQYIVETLLPKAKAALMMEEDENLPDWSELDEAFFADEVMPEDAETVITYFTEYDDAVDALATDEFAAGGKILSTMQDGVKKYFVKAYDANMVESQKTFNIYDANNADVLDNKPHFNIGTDKQAKDVRARVKRMKDAPKWYKGTIRGLRREVLKAINKKYPLLKPKPVKENSEELTQQRLQKMKDTAKSFDAQAKAEDAYYDAVQHVADMLLGFEIDGVNRYNYKSIANDIVTACEEKGMTPEEVIALDDEAVQMGEDMGLFSVEESVSKKRKAAIQSVITEAFSDDRYSMKVPVELNTRAAVDIHSADNVYLEYSLDVESRSWGIKNIDFSMLTESVEIEYETTDGDDENEGSIIVPLEEMNIEWTAGRVYIPEKLVVELNEDGSLQDVTLLMYYIAEVD